MPRLILGVCAFGAILVFQPVPASAEPVSLDPVVIVSSRLPVTVGQEAESLTVITRVQIERMGAATGADLLRQVPGVQVDQLGGPGGISQVYIRGSDPNHVLVLIDGIRMNDPTNSRGGGFDASDLEPSHIERIEVLRGAASAIYGADAMGGVINIVTRKSEPGESAGAAVGGHGYRSLNARRSWNSGSQGLLSAAASTLQDGLASEGGQLKLSQVSLAGSFEPSPTSRVEMDFRHAERRSSAFPDDSGGLALAEIRSLEQKKSHTTTFGLRGSADVAAWTLTLQGTVFKHHEDIGSPGVAPGIRSNLGIPASISTTDYGRNGALLSAVRHMEGGSEWAIGAEYLHEYGTSRTVYELFGTSIPTAFDLKRRTASGFSELKWLVSRDVVVRAGLRYDDIAGSGSHTSPSIGVRSRITQFDGAFNASYSEGFKPPSFFALGLPPVLGGNPALKAERSKGGSLGYQQRLGTVGNASVAVFRRRYDGLVTFSTATNSLVNADQVDVKGVELAAEFQASQYTSLQATYTRLISHRAPSGEPLRQRPGQRAGIQLNLKLLQKASLVWRLEFADEIFDSSIPTGDVFLRSYLRNDLVFNFALSKGINLTAAVDNVANRNNQWYIGAPSLGRRVRVGATFAI